jgi:Lysozyme like domain
MSRVLLGAVGAVMIGMLLLAGTVGAVTTGYVAPQPEGAAPPSAGRLTVAEIGTYAGSAGFSGSSLVMAIAVALAESGGDPSATDHDRNGTTDRGLWQINSIHTQYSATCDYDPSCAARAAFEISDGGHNWQPWVTYQNGAEIPFISEALAWVDQQPSSSQGGA